MITAIFCETCGRTIPHAEPGLTEHVGHRVVITRRPSASDAEPFEPKDSKLVFVLGEEARKRPVTFQSLYTKALHRTVTDLGLDVRYQELHDRIWQKPFPPDLRRTAPHGDPLLGSVSTRFHEPGRSVVYSVVGPEDLYSPPLQPISTEVHSTPTREHWAVGARIVPPTVRGTTRADAEEAKARRRWADGHPDESASRPVAIGTAAEDIRAGDALELEPVTVSIRRARPRSARGRAPHGAAWPPAWDRL
jgi:hypothetical protein